MNARDFCFWLQGYTELTGGEYPPSATWSLILEHLELAKLEQGFSEEQFEGVIEMLSGFVSVSGNSLPSEEQWSRIVDIVADVFIKVTSSLEEVKDNDPKDILEIIKEEIEKNHRKHPINPICPPYQPYPAMPWKEDRTPIDTNPWTMPPTITCSNGPPTSVFCTSTLDSTLDKNLDVAFDILYKAEISAGDMYSNQEQTTTMYELGVKLGSND